MPLHRKFFLRVALIGGLLIYLIADLWLWHGPLRRQIDRFHPSGSRVVARVMGHPITRGQLERAVRASLWLDGKSLESLTPEARAHACAAALEDLIDHELLRIKTTEMAAQLVVNDAEIQQRIEQFRHRFESPEAMQWAMKSQGITGDGGLRGILTARIQQEKFVARQIAPLVAITDAQARQWFDRNRRSLTIPERIEARHLFIPTLEQAPEAAKAKLAAALADLTAMRKDFATLAKELSEDPATQNTGGQLGWMTRDRLPADFAAPVFSLPLHQPSLVRSRLGWHLVEVTAHKPAQPQSFDQAKPEILAALETIQRRYAVTQCRTALRRLEAPHIQVYHELMRCFTGDSRLGCLGRCPSRVPSDP